MNRIRTVDTQLSHILFIFGRIIKSTIRYSTSSNSTQHIYCTRRQLNIKHSIVCEVWHVPISDEPADNMCCLAMKIRLLLTQKELRINLDESVCL